MLIIIDFSRCENFDEIKSSMKQNLLERRKKRNGLLIRRLLFTLEKIFRLMRSICICQQRTFV